MEIKVGSRFSIGEKVNLNLYKFGIVDKCEVSSVKFTDYGKVLYDVKVYPFQDDERLHIILKDIDSYFIEEVNKEDELC